MLNPFSLPHSPCGGLPTPVAHLRGGSQAAAQVCANEAAVSVVAGSAAVNGDGHVDRDSDEDAHGSHCVDSTFALNIGGLHVSLTASRTPQRVCASDADRLTSPHRRGSAVPVAGADGASTPALTSERIGVWCWSPRPALRLVTGALTRGVPHVFSMGQVAPLGISCTPIGGEISVSRGRSEPATGSTITAISDGIRAVNMVFLRDGVIDEHEFAAIRVLRNAAGKAAWADWNRRAGQAWENDGGLNGRLEREARELGSQFPPDAA